ncbi:hypothetical protein KKC49_03795 [Patescibacteria group bacterium]|nr:hypothetical protein [Patescibacteria group bacterium]MCG2699802.1 hypothetical protein [Candidatus Parcubacteria bacterium]
MAICNSFLKEEDDALIEAAQRGEFSGIQSCSPEIQEAWEKAAPAIEAANQVRSLEILGENFDNLRERTEKQLAESEDPPTDLQRVSRESYPTSVQLHEMVVEAEKVRMSEDEVISAPLICAAPGAAGTKNIIHDMLWAIENQRIFPYPHKDDQVFRKVVFMDSQSTGPTGAPSSSKFDPLTRTLFIFTDENGNFPSKEFIKDEILPHEIPHASDEFKIKLGARAKELEAVIAIEKTSAQLKGISTAEKRDISPYIERLQALRAAGKNVENDLQLEWVSECVRLYAKGKCSQTTKEFFDEIFSD